ncbi:MAG: response regulator [Azoarcus sp.]|nr:response regulator [Azoarcus sp.]
MRILLVEDDDLIASGMVAGLAAHGIRAERAGTVRDARQACDNDRFEAVVLDLGLPDGDGLSVLASLRDQAEFTPVVILTARDGIEHRLTGLHSGADDYMVKPFDLRELAARLHAVVRRSSGRAVQTVQAGPLRLEPDSGLAWLDQVAVNLSRREIELLVHLADARGRWLSPEVLHERMYGSELNIGSNSLNVHIHNIRRKLGAEAIETTRGLGYRIGWKPA